MRSSTGHTPSDTFIVITGGCHVWPGPECLYCKFQEAGGTERNHSLLEINVKFRLGKRVEKTNITMKSCMQAPTSLSHTSNFHLILLNVQTLAPILERYLLRSWKADRGVTGLPLVP